MQLCGQADTPPGFLQNATGYRLGRRRKREGMPVDANKLDAMEAAVSHRDGKHSALCHRAAVARGLIDPRDGRRVLARCPCICREAEARVLKANTFGALHA